MKDVKCPYCSKEQEINHDDGYGYEQDVLHEQQCSYCDKYFAFRTSIHFYYEAYKADCLNDGEHNFKATTTYPIECTQMECVDCEARRSPTKEEWKIIKVEANKTKCLPDDVVHKSSG